MKTATVDNVVKESIAPMLKEAGFAKKGRTWNRSAGDLVYVIDVQESRYNDSNRSRVTINLGVYSAKAFTICWGRSIGNFVKETDCLLRKRVGELLTLSGSTLSTDYWWKLETKEDAAAVGAEIVTVLRGRVLPYLRSINSLESLRAAVAEQAKKNRGEVLSEIYLAILTAMLGDMEKAKGLLCDVGASAGDAWKPRIEQVLGHLQEHVEAH